MKRVYKYSCLSLLLIFSLNHIEMFAQSKEAKTDIITIIDSLIADYRYESAIHLIEQELIDNEKNAKKKKKKKNISTELLKKKMELARKGYSFLQSTEKITFLDSLVVSKSDMLSSIHIDEEAGKIGSISFLIPTYNAFHIQMGASAYMNELEDRIIFSASKDSSTTHLYITERIDNEWSKPVELKGLHGTHMDYPYLLQDGITLYYSTISDEGLGGYDIYVTTYDTENNTFLTSENVGMPFNSPQNDYFCLIDEINQIGWLATDRGQSPDSVCIYTFIPSQTREIYNDVLTGDEYLIKYAKIQPLKESQADAQTIKTIYERIKRINKDSKYHLAPNNSYVINDNIIYSHLAQFKSDAARQIAIEWDKEKNTLQEDLIKLNELRKLILDTTSNQEIQEYSNQIVKLEKKILRQRELIAILEKNMRKAEQGY